MANEDEIEKKLTYIEKSKGIIKGVEDMRKLLGNYIEICSNKYMHLLDERSLHGINEVDLALQNFMDQTIVNIGRNMYHINRLKEEDLENPTD